MSSDKRRHDDDGEDKKRHKSESSKGERDRHRDSDRDRDREHKDRGRDDRERHTDRDRDRDRERERDRRDKDKDDKDRDRKRDRDDDRPREKDRQKRDAQSSKPSSSSSSSSTTSSSSTSSSKSTSAAPLPSSTNVKDLLASIQAAKQQAAKDLEESKRKKEMEERLKALSAKVDAKVSMLNSKAPLETPTPTPAPAPATAPTPTDTPTTETSDAPDVPHSKYFDPRLPVARNQRVKRPAFQFKEEGTFTRLAERIRNRAVQQDIEAMVAQSSERQDQTSFLDSIKEEYGLVKKADETQSEFAEAVPDMEWWDALLVRSEEHTYHGTQEEAVPELNDDLWQYIEHPLPLPPIGGKADVVEVLPLMLTKDELKKMRRRNRYEMLKDKEERVWRGIEPPPPPKVKISNMYKVLTSQAVADPTQVEREVRKEVQTRLHNHETRNHARMLTPEERKAKEIAKMKADREKGLICAVFRVRDLSHKLIRAKIDHNAQENMLTGAAVLYNAGGVNLVVVEGGAKGLKIFKKLMLRRIDWAHPPPPADGGKGDPEADPDALGQASTLVGPNSCVQVWEGSIIKANFRHFIFNACPTEAAARKFLQDRQMGHLWDMAKNYRDPIDDTIL